MSLIIQLSSASLLYFKVQSSVLISLFLTHKIKKRGKKFFIFPKPQNTPFQKIFFEKGFGARYSIEREKNYGNKFLAVDLKKLRQKEKKFYYLALLNLGWRKKPIKITKSWLQEDRFIQPNLSEIKKIAQRVKSTSQNGKINEIETVKNAFDFVVENLKYDRPIKGLYSTKEALEALRGKTSGVDCGGFSTFLIAILRSLKIPSRLAVGFLIKMNKLNNFLLTFDFCALNFALLSMHSWVEVFTKEKGFLSLDPSVYWRYKKGLSKRKTYWGKYFKDRIVFSYGEDFNFRNYKIDILQNAIYL